MRTVCGVELVATGPGVVLDPDGEHDAIVTVVLGAVRIPIYVGATPRT